MSKRGVFDNERYSRPRVYEVVENSRRQDEEIDDQFLEDEITGYYPYGPTDGMSEYSEEDSE